MFVGNIRWAKPWRYRAAYADLFESRRPRSGARLSNFSELHPSHQVRCRVDPIPDRTSEGPNSLIIIVVHHFENGAMNRSRIQFKNLRRQFMDVCDSNIDAVELSPFPGGTETS